MSRTMDLTVSAAELVQAIHRMGLMGWYYSCSRGYERLDRRHRRGAGQDICHIQRDCSIALWAVIPWYMGGVLASD